LLKWLTTARPPSARSASTFTVTAPGARPSAAYDPDRRSTTVSPAARAASTGSSSGRQRRPASGGRVAPTPRRGGTPAPGRWRAAARTGPTRWPAAIRPGRPRHRAATPRRARRTAPRCTGAGRAPSPTSTARRCVRSRRPGAATAQRRPARGDVGRQHDQLVDQLLAQRIQLREGERRRRERRPVTPGALGLRRRQQDEHDGDGSAGRSADLRAVDPLDPQRHEHPPVGDHRRPVLGPVGVLACRRRGSSRPAPGPPDRPGRSRGR
jgi:hypothetical protein